MKHLKTFENFNNLNENTLATPYELDKAKREGDTFSETPIGKVDGFDLVYQTWSKLMNGDGISGTIGTVPENYYVATIDSSGDILFEDLESKTRDINKDKVTELYYKNNKR